MSKLVRQTIMRDTGLTLVLALLVMLGILIYQQGGYLHPESAAFLLHYNSEPFFKAIFDPERADWGAYQARELSYAWDYLDARLIAWCIQHQWTHFYSAGNIVLLLLTILVQQLGMRTLMPRLGRWLPAVLSLGFLLSPAADCFNFFRSAKPGVALGVTILLFGFYGLWRCRPCPPKWWRWMVALTMFLLPLWDRQGSFYLAVFTMILSLGLLLVVLNMLHIPHLTPVQLARWSAIGLGSVIGSFIYNCYLAPGLIEYFNGYRPSFGFQNLGMGWGDPTGGAIYLLDNVGCLFGRFNGIGALALGVAALLVIGGVLVYSARTMGQRLWCGVAGILVVATWVCGSLMVLRHPLLLRDDVIHSSYFLPALAGLIFFIALAGSWQRGKRRWNIAAWGGVLLLLVQISTWTCPVKLTTDHNEYYKKSAPYVRFYLNHPERDAREFPLPYSAIKLQDLLTKSR